MPKMKNKTKTEEFFQLLVQLFHYIISCLVQKKSTILPKNKYKYIKKKEKSTVNIKFCPLRTFITCHVKIMWTMRTIMAGNTQNHEMLFYHDIMLWLLSLLLLPGDSKK